MAQPLLAGQFTGQRRPRLLPIEPNSFIGRTAEAAAPHRPAASARLITVVGPGGVGKSRLCLRIAAAALSAGRFADGVVLVELSGVGDPALLASAVAAGLGLPERDAGLQRRRCSSTLRDRRLLLILDTCEHLVDACAASPTPCCAPRPRSPCSRPAGSRSTRRGSTPSRCRRCRSRPTRSSCSRSAPRRPRRVRRHRREPRGRRPALPAARRHPAGHRAGRGPAAGAAAGRAGRPLESGFSVLTGSRRGTAAAPDAARGDRVELRAVHPGRAAAVGAAFGLRRALRPRGGRGGLRGRGAAHAARSCTR